MIRKVPVQDPTNNQTFAFEGDANELLPKENTVYADEHGNTYDPHDNISLAKLPEGGVVAFPRTTWW